MESCRRTINLKVRLTPDEYAHLQAAAEDDDSVRYPKDGRVNYSRFYRKHLLAQTNFKNEELIKLQENLVYQVRKIGVNINQAVKRINAGYGRWDDAKLLLDELREVNLQMDQVIKECEKRWGSQN